MPDRMRRTPTPGSHGIVLCGSGKLQPRDECPNAIHDHPLPMSYLGAMEWAENRIANGWQNLACPECGRFGWKRPVVRDA